MSNEIGPYLRMRLNEIIDGGCGGGVKGGGVM